MTLNDRLTALFRQGAAWMIMIGILVTAAACNGVNGGSSITVLDPPVIPSDGDIVLDRIDRLDGVYGLDWVSDEELLGALPAASYDREVILYHLQSGKSNYHPMSLEYGSLLQISPDRNHVIILQRLFGKSRIVNLKSGDMIKLPVEGREVGGSWVDERTYVLPIFEKSGDQLVLVDIDGSISPLKLPKGVDFIQKVVMKEDHIYILDARHQLSLFVKGSTDTSLIRNGVTDFALSPDGAQISFVAETAPNQQSLFIMDSFHGKGKGWENGKEKKLVAMGRLIQQLSWSPDGRKLGFSAFSLDEGMTGLYVVNTGTGSTIAVSYKQNLKSAIIWSPSAMQFMVSEDNPSEIEGHAFTNIYRLK
ncbi:TolB family protein [Paenibacillus eucommiae]|uniref:Dipeptidyl aminopeptidase/acylaminoacyl peptidase n=1 Tax=Paenibacillus eucommiae TaxID=1355755 RepID=A0ABS4IR19_9BACL|nr:hypothetical protein [Paenibacillus eucommiae]MBP1990017.1 dipeptidyl aminopeptidase/acylaminoacyl peptidase [Paenibacillus eucommiae]